MQPRVQIVFEEPGAASSVAATLKNRPGIEELSVEGATIVLTSDMSVGQIVEEMNGNVGEIQSIGSTKPALRDVLNLMLRPSESDAQ